ncbi:MAG: hypothetical protein NPIRA05_09110 [Nitrospirales bacterium]|nr:MAG: hypothetical protein NPIRA05_09110 [Nitrospirales bacterium]
MLTLYAPGLTKGHLILRELTTSEGKQTLLLTAPEAVTAHVQRVTLYFQGLPETMVLFEEVDGEWKKRFPQAMTIDSRIDGTISTQAIRAFSVKNLGFYWLLEPATAMPAVFYTPLATSAMTLMGGELTRGLMPSILAIMLLLVFGAVSRYIHKTSKLREL